MAWAGAALLWSTEMLQSGDGPGMGPREYRIFVYGTLVRGGPRHRMLARARFLGEARTAPRFTLLDLGSCPAMTRGGRAAVRGELYAVDGPTLAALDRYEWHPRYYRRETVRLSDGGTATAYLVAPGRIRGVPRIASGDWRLRERPRPRIRKTPFEG